MENSRIFDFDHIQLVPKLGIVSSRSQCDTSIKFGKHKFDLPIIPANMKSVVDETTCEFYAKRNIMYVYHRFFDDFVENSIKFIIKMKENNLISSISIGVNDESWQLINELKKRDLQPDYITIDIAHGHSLQMKNILNHIKDKLESFIIAGNVGSIEGVIDVAQWGADALKIGIASGSGCSTRLKTGFGNYGYQCSLIEQCSGITKKPIISDGGIRHHCDFAKSIVMGATMIMAGSMFAGYDESPGDIFELENGSKVKEYYGSASEFNKKERKHIEGFKIHVPYNGSLEDKLKEIKEDLQSSISYSGGKTLESLKNCEYIILK